MHSGHVARPSGSKKQTETNASQLVSDKSGNLKFGTFIFNFDYYHLTILYFWKSALPVSSQYIMIDLILFW